MALDGISSMNATEPTESSPRAIIAVVGDAGLSTSSSNYALAEEVGRLLIDRGFRIVTGGLGGVMEAASKGARSSAAYRSGDVIALLPGRDRSEANPFADIVLPTGLDHVRNAIVALADAVVVVGGGAGTLTEIAFAWMHKRLIVALKPAGGWGARLADQRVDERVRYPDMLDDRVFGVESPVEVAEAIARELPRYQGVHRGIRRPRT